MCLSCRFVCPIRRLFFDKRYRTRSEKGCWKCETKKKPYKSRIFCFTLTKNISVRDNDLKKKAFYVEKQCNCWNILNYLSDKVPFDKKEIYVYGNPTNKGRSITIKLIAQLKWVLLSELRKKKLSMPNCKAWFINLRALMICINVHSTTIFLNGSRYHFAYLSHIGIVLKTLT